MSRRLALLALPLGFALAVAIGACGSGDAEERGATLEQPPIATRTSAPATTGTTATTTVPTTTTATTVATTPTQTTATTPTTSTQPTGGAPAGCPAVVGGFIRDLRGSDCSVAGTVAQGWFDAVHEGAAPDAPIDVAGYACSATLAGERASVTCSGSRGTVLFTASP